MQPRHSTQFLKARKEEGGEEEEESSSSPKTGLEKWLSSWSASLRDLNSDVSTHAHLCEGWRQQDLWGVPNTSLAQNQGKDDTGQNENLGNPTSSHGPHTRPMCAYANPT